MSMIVIVLGIIVVLLIFILISYFSNNSTKLITKSSLLTGNTIIPIKSSLDTTRYAFGAWICVNSWSMNGDTKTIFTFPGKITLYLDSNTPTLFASIPTSGSLPTIITITQNFPLQKWTYVTISADNSYIDSYIDGKLMKSIKLENLQTNHTDKNVYLGGNPPSLNDIVVAKFYRWTNALAPQDVWNEYMKGNGNMIARLLSSYGLDLTLKKNNIDAATFNIF
jgi:hypothetical protein